MVNSIRSVTVVFPASNVGDDAEFDAFEGYGMVRWSAFTRR